MTDQPSQTPLTQEQIEELRGDLTHAIFQRGQEFNVGEEATAADDRMIIKLNALCDMALALSAARRDAEVLRWIETVAPITVDMWRQRFGEDAAKGGK